MIAIPVYVREEKNYKLLKACLDSIDKVNNIHRLDLFVNAFDITDVDLESLAVCWFREKNSVAGAWNDAIEKCFKSKQLIVTIANQDIEFPKLENLEQIAQEKGICAARTKEGEPDFALFAVNPEWIKETFGTLRPFDEGFEGAYFEDNDFRYQCKLKGIEIPTIELDFKHFGSSVVTLDLEAQKENEKRFRKNHIRYINKWGGIRNFETFKTPFNK